MYIGSATEKEIEEAVEVTHEEGCELIARVKCTVSYPTPLSSMHLRTLPDLAPQFGVVVGLSHGASDGCVPRGFHNRESLDAHASRRRSRWLTAFDLSRGLPTEHLIKVLRMEAVDETNSADILDREWLTGTDIAHNEDRAMKLYIC